MFSTDALGYVPNPPAHRARARLKRVDGQVDSTVTRPGGVRLRFLSTGNEGAAIDLPILSLRLTPEPQKTQEKNACCTRSASQPTPHSCDSPALECSQSTGSDRPMLLRMASAL